MKPVRDTIKVPVAKGEIWAFIDYEKELRHYSKIARCTVQDKPFWMPGRAKATPPADF